MKFSKKDQTHFCKYPQVIMLCILVIYCTISFPLLVEIGMRLLQVPKIFVISEFIRVLPVLYLSALSQLLSKIPFVSF